MSIPSISTSTPAVLATQLLQQLMGTGTSSRDSSGLEGLLGDLVDFSSASQQLAQAPDAVTEAMNSLLAGPSEAQGDLSSLAAFLQQNPSSLASILGSLQGTAGTYNASGSLAGNGALVAAMLSTQGSTSARASLLNLLMTNQAQDPLLAPLGGDENGSTDSSWSFLG